MPRLIDADELLLRFIPRGGDNNFTRFVRETVRLRLAEMPTVDAEPVVRCKDCRYASLTYDGECKYCQKWKEKYDGESVSLYLDGDFYCAFGERREDASNEFG